MDKAVSIHAVLHRLFIGVALGMLCTSLSIAASVNTGALRAHAEYLASDLLEGRATGSRGYDLAAGYVAAQFRQYGLLPVVGDSYLQSVPLIEATTVLPASSAVLRRDAQVENFEFGNDFLPAANFFNPTLTQNAPMTFVGFGINAPELGYDDFAGLDLQGRIALVLDGAPERFNGAAATWHGWRNTKYAQLAKRGAAGVIEIPLPDGNADSLWERQVDMAWVPDLRLTQDELPLDEFATLKLRFRFRYEAAARLFPSNNGHSLHQALSTAQAGESGGFVLPGQLTLSATTGLRRLDSPNVIGVLRGSDPRLRDEYVLLVAHLDHLGRGAAVSGDAIYNGLQHNAVGVAMLLEAARALTNGAGTGETGPKRSVIFAAVTAGDKGAQGLRYLLSAEPFARRRVVGAVVLDTPLPLARTSDVMVVGAEDSSLGIAASTAAQAQGLRLSHARATDGSLLMTSLEPLVRAGVPVLEVQSGMRASGRADVRALRREYQQNVLFQPSDDLATAPVHWGAAREIAAFNHALLLDIANTERAPVWYRSSLIHRKLAEQ